MTDQLLREENETLRACLRELQNRFREPEEIVRAIRHGEVDAFVVTERDGEQIYSLRTADVLFRAMVEHMKEGAAALDPSGLILYCNSHFAGLLGSERKALAGASLMKHVDDQCRSFIDQGCQCSDTVRGEIELCATDGTRVPVQTTMSRISVDGGDICCLIVTDLREQRRRLELLAESNRKDEFLAMLAHELRNPLAPIRNATALLGMPEVSRESLDWARQLIDRQVTQLARLLDDLLDVQRITRGLVTLRTQPLELGAVIDDALEAAGSSLTRKSQTLHVERFPEPLAVQADPARLTQVIANLLGNSIKYSPSGSNVWVSWKRDASVAEIRIADDGIGMTSELLAHIFEPFVQGDRDFSRSEGGLGIGLTLVHRLMQLHGGSVSASSAGPGKGSEFLVRIPLLADVVNVPGRVRPAERASAQPSARRILVVDDNQDSALSLRMLLQHAGYEVDVAHDGSAALRAAESFRPEVMILDLGLPGMDGYELARRVRDSSALSGCRLIALTGYGAVDDRRRSSEVGFEAHFIKPVDLDELLGMLRP